MSNQKIVIGRTRKDVKNPVNFNLEVKGQRRIGIMNVRDTSSHCDTPMCQNGQLMSNQKKITDRTQKPYKFGVGVKDQRRIGIMNVCDW